MAIPKDDLDPALKRQLGERREYKYQSFSGADIQAIMYLPLITLNSLVGDANKPRFKIFAELQTISISSTRSVSPVRVLGRSNPVTYTRGARTIAGSLVFASVNKDVFSDIYDVDVAESFLTASSSLISDQLPPFSIVITAANESGGLAAQVIHGITLTNFGTTYSIDDIYTEVVHTYVATDITPLYSSITQQNRLSEVLHTSNKSISQLLEDSLYTAYGTEIEKAQGILRATSQKETNSLGLDQIRRTRGGLDRRLNE